MRPVHRITLPGVLALALSSCAAFGYPSGTPSSPGPLAAVPGANPGESYVIQGRRYYVMRSARGYRAVGMASWYGPGFDGRPTSSGDTFDQNAMTAAHRTLPLGTRVKVTNLANGRSVVVLINDRGPFKDPEHRIIDLSWGAAQKIGLIQSGTARVEVRALPPD